MHKRKLSDPGSRQPVYPYVGGGRAALPRGAGSLDGLDGVISLHVNVSVNHDAFNRSLPLPRKPERTLCDLASILDGGPTWSLLVSLVISYAQQKIDRKALTVNAFIHQSMHPFIIYFIAWAYVPVLEA